MIHRFGEEAALLLVDVQRGVDQLMHWGGPDGRRNNPDAERHILAVLDAWRARRRQVIFTLHDSREAASPLKLSQPGGALKEGFEIAAGEITITKDVNSAFVGTPLELALRRHGITRLVVAGFFTNMCVSTTVRMANNLGYDSYLVGDGCACTNRTGPDGTEHDPETVHDVTVASLHGEFCTALDHEDVIDLLDHDDPSRQRLQGNE